ncbi:translation initiation factor IF-2-like [Falco cherrug]|uniref:translation initiation factor IF-2-like n=1 Tax=Falco cherrug TaxID=345164 RepID=UPI00247A2D53|nr:translation initiation factor IF-2-like [Falco cherrug]
MGEPRRATSARRLAHSIREEGGHRTPRLRPVPAAGRPTGASAEGCSTRRARQRRRTRQAVALRGTPRSGSRSPALPRCGHPAGGRGTPPEGTAAVPAPPARRAVVRSRLKVRRAGVGPRCGGNDGCRGESCRPGPRHGRAPARRRAAPVGGRRAPRRGAAGPRAVLRYGEAGARGGGSDGAVVPVGLGAFPQPCRRYSGVLPYERVTMKSTGNEAAALSSRAAAWPPLPAVTRCQPRSAGAPGPRGTGPGAWGRPWDPLRLQKARHLAYKQICTFSPCHLPNKLREITDDISKLAIVHEITLNRDLKLQEASFSPDRLGFSLSHYRKHENVERRWVWI